MPRCSPDLCRGADHRGTRRLHLLLRSGPTPTPCRGDEEPDAAGRPSTDVTTGRPGVMRVRQWGTFHSLAQPDETDAAGRPSTDLTTGRPGAMRVSQWGDLLLARHSGYTTSIF